MRTRWAVALLCVAAAVPGQAQLLAPVAPVLGQAVAANDRAPAITGPGIGFGNRAENSVDPPRADDAGSWFGLVAGSRDVVRLVAGAPLGEQLAAEAGLVRVGALERGEPDARARNHATGIDLGALVRLPLGSAMAAYARLGLLWSRAGSSAGSDSGWGPSYGAGLRIALAPHWRVQLGWERQATRVAGARQHVDSAGLGLLYQR